MVQIISVNDKLHIHLHDEFEESDHPRAKSGSHAGEFVKKGSGQTVGVRASLVEAHPDRAKWPSHIKNLKIPPAWTNVKISQNPKADLLAIGKDAKGRDQYIYSAKYAESQAAAKFKRVQTLSTILPQLQKRNDKNLISRDDKVREHAECLGLIMATGLRPGSERDTGAEKTAYGATTLEGRHVVTEGNDTYLRFTGKKGVDLNIKIDDTVLANSLQDRAKKVGSDNQLFPGISDKSLRDYTKSITSGKAKPKDFRTLVGTSLAYQMVNGMEKPTNKSSYKKSVMEVAKAVSSKLGNTPAIALKAYISPFVFSTWKIEEAK